MSIIIKTIDRNDIDEVVKVHVNSFKDFFLTELGSEFLRTYYNSVLDSPRGILLGAYKDGCIVGFCAACTWSVGFNMHLIKSNLYRFGLIGCKLLFTRPQALLRLMKNISKKGHTEDQGNYAEIMSIAVDRQKQCSGIGNFLVDDLESILSQCGVAKLSLTTDKNNNAQALGFYKKKGFKELYEFTAYPNRIMYRLIKEISYDKKA